MQHKTGKSAVFLLALVLLGKPSFASGPIHLNTFGDAQAAIAAGTLRTLSTVDTDPFAVQGRVMQNDAFGLPAELRNSQFPTTTPPAGTAFYTTSGSAADLNSHISGAYDYCWIIDPSLAGSHLNISLFLPHVFSLAQPYGLDTLAIAISDTTNRVMLWRWDSTVLTTGSNNFNFDFNAGVGAGGSTSFFVDPGFDLNNVIQFQVGYQGQLTPAFPPDPEGRIGLWAGTEHVQIVPEPGVTTLLVSVAGFGVVMVSRRRRAK
jgi:hypothetical protein